MFKLPAPPSPRATACELADFFELLCWLRTSVSRQEVLGFLGEVGDNLQPNNEAFEGCADADDVNEPVVDDALIEVDRRKSSCCSGYPFQVNDSGTVLYFSSANPLRGQDLVYLYLLVATRLNMNSHRDLGGIDGTLEMEKLSAYALQTYLGSSRGRSEVFGTSVGGSFRARVERLCEALKEPTKFHNIDGEEAGITAQDDKLDVVGWLPFGDASPGQLIVFAQAKTGTNWRDKCADLNPEAFQNKWLSKRFLVNPLRAFCVSEAVLRATWNSTCCDGGLLFDRCRIVECSVELPTALEENLRAWLWEARSSVASGLGIEIV